MCFECVSSLSETSSIGDARACAQTGVACQWHGSMGSWHVGGKLLASRRLDGRMMLFHTRMRRSSTSALL
eukprot:9841443-Alexandrium_andersonii.AAC.1